MTGHIVETQAENNLTVHQCYLLNYCFKLEGMFVLIQALISLLQNVNHLSL